MKYPAFEKWLVRASGGDEHALAVLLTENLLASDSEMVWALLEEASPKGLTKDSALDAARMVLARAKEAA